MKYLKQIIAVVLLCAYGTASAAISSGYYYVKSYNDKYLTENNTEHTLVCSDLASPTNYAQVWYLTVTGSNVTIKNALTDRYVQKTTGNSWSEQYLTGSSSNAFTLNDEGNGIYTFTDKWSAGPHCDAALNVVLWVTEEAKSKWTIEAVTINPADLASAQSAYNLSISSGYYHIVSNNYSGRYMTENMEDQTLSTGGSTGSYAQVWYLEIDEVEHTATLRNALTDHYVQTQAQTSALYTVGETAKAFYLSETKGSPNTYSFTDTGGAGLHCAETQSYNVVRWNSTDDASIWQIEPFSYNESIRNAQRAALTEATIDQLKTFFTTTACTALKSTYANYTDANLRSAMSSLPTTVQDLAVKVKNNAWTTYNGWDKTEKTFRIADYKPYSSHTQWTNILSKGHSMGRLSNPTGIWVNSGDYLQVYVGAIPSNQTVKLEVVDYGGQNGQACGTQYSLHQGMNALQMASAGNCFVFHEVDNTTDGTAPFKLLSNYTDVTVHIEGGTVQGYFDLTKGDTDSDWTQLKRHLLTDATNRPAVCLKTDKHVMNLGITRLINALNGSSITEMLNVWKNLSEWEDELMGRSDAYGGQNTYGQYCNNVYSVTALPGTDGNPHASNYGTYYYECSDPLIFNANALMTVADNMWCIAHEQGHNRQTPINMVGNTEISNNLFSNVAIYKQGRYTSRTASIKDVFNDYIDGISWPERVQRANNGVADYNQQLLHLNWSLYLFFHVLGNDPDFFPRLFDALREDPMTKNYVGYETWTDGNTYAAYHVAAEDDYLKYYIKCCQVSCYDLTDFFASYGFFQLPTEQSSKQLNNSTQTRYTVFNDYSIYYLYVTQPMIDSAKAQVAAMSGLKKCNIIFIEDRVTAPLATYEGHAEGELRTINPDSPVKSFGQVGETGQYTDFGAACSAYGFNVDKKGHVTVSGSGAVGFIVYDADGNIVGYYNTYSFKLPDNIGTGYTIKAAAGDGSQVVATKDTSIEVVITEFPHTDMWYSFRSLRDNRFVLSNSAGEGVVGTTDATLTDSKQWKFVAREGEVEAFDIVNRNDGSYLDPIAESNCQIFTTTTQPSTGWRVKPAATEGLYIITTGSAQLNQTTFSGTNGNMIYNWGGGGNRSDEGCQFTIAEVESIDIPVLSDEALEELEGYGMNVSSTAASNLITGQWYVMFDRGTSPGNHGYLYEQVSSHTLYNTASVPSGLATDACKYLVRLLDADGSKYYLQTGYGNYFGQIQASTTVPVLPTKTQRITVAKIANTDGHFYLQGETGGVILDANDVRYGDATVVGWGTSVPTAIGGNNDWAFYPVTLIGRGDVNGDGQVTIADVTALVNIILGKATDEYGVADINGDEQVTIADVTALVNIILGN